MKKKMNSYDQYLNRPDSKIPQINREILEKDKEIPFEKLLKIENKNKLLEVGYLDAENGFYHFEDGSAYAAVLTPMPKVTVEMIDWWFWWHAKEPIRYKIWYPEMHFDISSDFGKFYDDESKTYRERLHLSTHFVTENIGTGKEKIIIDFMSPEEFGFYPSNLKIENDETIICAKVGSFSKRSWHTKMCHAVRKINDGIEMRSRFWIGKEIKRMDKFGENIINSVLNKPFVKKKLIPKNIGRYMFHHCTQEYNNLASILPEIFKEETSRS